MRFRNFVRRTFLGLGIGCVVGTITVGFHFILFLLASVVCTYGAGLLVIIPVAYLIGLLATREWRPLETARPKLAQAAHLQLILDRRGWRPLETGRPKQPKTEVAPPPDLADHSLVRYIRAAAAEGVSHGVIAQDLLDAGWEANRIRRALKAASLEPDSSSLDT